MAKKKRMSQAVRKLAELLPRKAPGAAVSPFTPRDLREMLPGLPEGAITEISGPRSSGRTTVLHSTLAEAAAFGELCALVDASDAFDPASAAAGGVRLERVLWVRCHHDVEDAVKAADLILHAGGFRLVILDLCDVDPRDLRKIPVSWWHRLRLAVEGSKTVLVVGSPEPVLRQSAAVHLELIGKRVHWSTLLDGMEIHVKLRKPVQSAAMATMRAEAQGV
jgi:hypothetical protein